MIERIAPPEACGEGGCTWTSARQRFAFIRDEAGLASACQQEGLVIANFDATAVGAPCAGTLIDSANLAQRGGALIYAEPNGLRIERAFSPNIRRPWTPQGVQTDQE